MAKPPRGKLGIEFKLTGKYMVTIGLLMALILARGSALNSPLVRTSQTGLRIPTNAPVLTQSQSSGEEDVVVLESGIIGIIWDAIMWLLTIIWKGLVWLGEKIWALMLIIPWWLVLKITLVLIVIAVITAVVGYFVMRIWLKHRQSTNYDYNIFDDPELSAMDKLSLRNLRIEIPSSLAKLISSSKGSAQHNGQQIIFNQAPGRTLAVRLNSSIGQCRQYKYFEIDLVENSDDSAVYIGLCEKQNFHNDQLPDTADTTVIFDGTTGDVQVGQKNKKFNYQMKYFGDVGGLLLYKDFEDSEDRCEVVPTSNGTLCNNLEMPDEIQSRKTFLSKHYKKKKKSKTKAADKKEDKEKDKLEKKRKKEMMKHKLFIPNHKGLYPFIACDGPCTFDVNFGRQVFHCHHEEFEKGLMQ
ncbi:unnamed protein product [Moneuplotes crassus]|uniref:Uncharacterized protein n=1 Tax=Euplotes crassus TaxID=5936 RepID=A0AAD1XFV9_EUPCR|nr:unnamed protein product [Moneuplotes crassus]